LTLKTGNLLQAAFGRATLHGLARTSVCMCEDKDEESEDESEDESESMYWSNAAGCPAQQARGSAERTRLRASRGGHAPAQRSAALPSNPKLSALPRPAPYAPRDESEEDGSEDAARSSAGGAAPAASSDACTGSTFIKVPGGPRAHCG